MIGYTRFINTMKQEPVVEQLLPLTGERMGAPEAVWDYLYEPDAKAVLDQVLTRYIEAIIYQAVAENMASEQSARMVAMKSASDNAETLIDELTLIYNKNRAGRRSPRNFRRSSAAQPPSERNRTRIERQDSHGTRHHRPVHRRGDRHRVSARGDAQDLRRADRSRKTRARAAWPRRA